MELLDEYIRFYNERRKQSLGWMSPMQYRISKGLALGWSRESSAPPKVDSDDFSHKKWALACANAQNQTHYLSYKPQKQLKQEGAPRGSFLYLLSSFGLQKAKDS